MQSTPEISKSEKFYEELKFLFKDEKRMAMSQYCEDVERKIHQAANDDERCLLGCVLFTLGEYEKAIPHLTTAVKNPNLQYRDLASLCLGRALLGERRYAESLGCFSGVLKEYKDYQTIAHNYCGEALIALCRYKEAKEHFDQVLISDSNNEKARVLQKLALSLMKKQTLEQQANPAITPVSGVSCTITPTSSSNGVSLKSGWHSSLGAFLKSQVPTTTASSSTATPMQTTPEVPPSPVASVGMRAINTSGEGRSYFYEYITPEHNPLAAQMHFEFGKEEFNDGQYEGAINHFKEAQTNGMDSVEFHSLCGMALSRLGKGDAAAEHFSKVPSTTTVASNLSRLFLPLSTPPPVANSVTTSALTMLLSNPSVSSPQDTPSSSKIL